MLKVGPVHTERKTIPKAMRLCKRSEWFLNDTKLHENGKRQRNSYSGASFGLDDHLSFAAKVIEIMVTVLRRFRCTSLPHSTGVNDPFIETHFIIHFLCDESERLRSRV